MKRKIIQIGLLSVLVIGSGVSGRAQEEVISSKNQARWNLSMQTAAHSLVDSLQELAKCDADTSTLLIEGMVLSMQNDTESHQMIAESREKTLEGFDVTVNELIFDLVKESVKFAQLQSSILVTEELLIGKVGISYWEELKVESLKNLKKNHFRRLFKAARLRVVLEQRYDLERRFNMPSFDILNARLNSALPANAITREEVLLNEADFEVVSGLLKDDTENIGIVFEELSIWIRDRSGQKLEIVRDQYRDQIETLEKSASTKKMPEKLIEASAIKSYLKSVLAGSITKRKSDLTVGSNQVMATAVVYDAFDASILYAAPLAQELETLKFQVYIESIELPLPSKSQVEAWIASDLTAHQSFEESYEIVEDRSLAVVAKSLATGYVLLKEGKSNPKAEAYFIQMFGFEKPLDLVIQQAISDSLKVVFQDARKAVATSQLQKSFPEVVKQSSLQAGLVERMFIDNAMDQEFGFEEALNYMGQEGINNTSVFLDETKTHVVDYFNEEVKKDRAAILEQIRAVLEVEQKLIHSLQARIDRNDSYDMIFADWSREFDGVWKSSSEYSVSKRTETSEMAENILGWAVRQLSPSPVSIVTASLLPSDTIPVITVVEESDEVVEVKNEIVEVKKERDTLRIRSRETYERQRRKSNKR